MQARLCAMKAGFLFLILALSHAEGAKVVEEKESSPLKKVVQMMSDLLAKKRKEMEAEAKTFAGLQVWCKNTIADRSDRIDAADEELERLEAESSDAASRAQARGEEIEKLAADISSWQEQMVNHKETREAQHKTYEAAHKDVSESVDALERAVTVLKRQPDAVAQSSFIQTLPESAQRIVQTFVQTSEDPNAYENHAGGIVEMLEGLLSDFREQRQEIVKGEMNEKHAHDMVIQDLTGDTKQATKVKARTLALKEEQEARKGKADEDYANTKSQMEDDKQYKKDTKAMCAEKELEFPRRKRAREGEIEAMVESQQILGEATTMDKNVGGAHFFLQMDSRSKSPNQARAVAFLIHEAHRTGSKNLSMLTEKIAEDPFVKVRKMIYDMIHKLKDQAAEEAEHKGWCDTEMGTNEQVRNDKTASVEKLTAQKEGLEADIAHQAKLIADLASDISNLEKELTTATDNRREEYQTNTVTIKDCEDGQRAVEEALGKLKTYYRKMGKSTFLLQSEVKVYESKEAVDDFAAHSGDLDAEAVESGDASGPFAFLENIITDFAQKKSDTAAAEATAAAEFENMKNDAQRDIAVAQQNMKNKEQRKAESEVELGSTKSDLANSNKELGAANRYHQKLIPSCVDQGQSHEERMAARAAEIQSLKEALEILNSQE